MNNKDDVDEREERTAAAWQIVWIQAGWEIIHENLILQGFLMLFSFHTEECRVVSQFLVSFVDTLRLAVVILVEKKKNFRGLFSSSQSFKGRLGGEKIVPQGEQHSEPEE